MKKKLLLIGWDAADWKIISPLMDAGKMPNLERFASHGVVGNLSTIQPVLSPMLWTSIATGKRAYKHGIHGFAEPDFAGGVRPVTNLGRKSKALWNILNQSGLKSNVVGWWPSHPAEPINGVMVSNQFQTVVAPPDKPWPMKPRTVHPNRLSKPMEEFRVHTTEILPEQILPFVPGADDVDQDNDQRLAAIAKTLAECASVHAASTHLIQSEGWDFMAVYHDAIDHFCHGFMKYHPPQLQQISDKDFALYSGVINTAYQFHDLMLGSLMELAGEETTIMICSDHGFHPDHLRPVELPNEGAGPAEEHRHFGMFAAMGPGIKKDELVFGASLLDITPTILQAFDLPTGRDMDGRPLLSIFERTAPIPPIDSWEDVEGDSGQHPDNMAIDPVDDIEALKQLVDLGYINDVGDGKGLAVDNTVKELRYNLARDYVDAGMHTEAAPILQDLWDQHNDENRFGIILFDCLLALGHLEAASSTLDLIITRKQDLTLRASAELAELLEKNKDNENPGKQLSQKIRRLKKQAGTSLASIAFFRGKLLLAEGRYEQALTEFEKAANVQTHNLPSLLQLKGEVLLKMRRWIDAEACYAHMLTVEPANAGAQHGLAYSLTMQKGKQAEALEAISSSLGLVFHNARAHYLSGRLLQRAGRSDNAIRAFETAVSINTVYPAAHRRLAQLYRAQNDETVANVHDNLARAAISRLLLRQNQGQTFTVHDAQLDQQDGAIVKTGEQAVLHENMPPLEDDEIVIVSGLPRSGTSMLMQMLDAGGVTVLTDGIRRADDDNKRGYYEYEPSKGQASEAEWMAQAPGNAVKIVAQLLPQLPTKYRYRIIMMERPLREVVESQKMMLFRLGKKGANLSEEQLMRAFSKQVASVSSLLDSFQSIASVLPVNYHDTLITPEATAKQLNYFLGGELNEQAMAGSVEPTMRRQFGSSIKLGVLPR